MHKISTIWIAIRAAIYFGLSVFFGYAFYTNYWKYRDCIAAAESSCITSERANLTSGGMFWIVVSIFFY